MKHKILLFTLLFFSFASRAQWADNTSVNNLVVGTSATSAKNSLVAINDGSNNMIIAWIDARNTTSGNDIYIQKINKDGSLPWGAEKVVCDAIGAQANISLIGDGSGGAILVWDDNREAVKEIYGQRIDASGSIKWTANGVILSVLQGGSTTRQIPVAERLSATEFAVVWRDARNGTQDMYAQKCLISTGASQWTADVSVHGAQTGTQTAQALLADGSGNCFVIWGDPRLANTNADIYAQKLNNNGTLAWNASGLLLCDAAANQLTPQFVSDNNGGFVAVWSDLRTSSTDGDIYAQRINASGVAQWTANGIKICGAANTQSNPAIINTSSNTFTLAWSDPRVSTSDRNLYAQKLDLNGNLLWAENGVSVVNATGNQGATGTEYALLTGTDGNAMLCWTDPRVSTSDYNIYAQKLKADGSLANGFVLNGNVIADNTANQRAPVAIADDNNGIMVAWQDSRTGASGEIYASRLFSNGTLPVSFTAIKAAIISGAAVQLSWSVASEVNTEKYLVERAATDGVFYKIAELAASNAGTYRFTDDRALSGSQYYRVTALDHDATISRSELVLVKLNLQQVQVNLYPNPVSEQASFSLQGITEAEAGTYELRIMDALGAVRYRALVKVEAGNAVLNLPVNNLSAGTYYVHLSGKNALLSALKVLIKI